MKKTFLFLAALLLTCNLAFSQKAGWAEGKTFHHFMSTTFHPTEEGNFKPLRAKSDSLLWAVEAWNKSPIPSNYKEKETKETLAKLVMQVKEINVAVKKNAKDETLKKMISDAHDTFHHIVGECKKTEETK